MPSPPMSDTLTQGIRVGAAAFYMPEKSDPDEHHWVFGYNILIVNQSDRRVQLLSRHWTIIDADGEQHTVDGEGVVGQQPMLEPGKAFKYSSFCPLTTDWGTMEGHYTFMADDWEQFNVDVGRFWLTTEQTMAEMNS